MACLRRLLQYPLSGLGRTYLPAKSFGYVGRSSRSTPLPLRHFFRCLLEVGQLLALASCGQPHDRRVTQTASMRAINLPRLGSIRQAHPCNLARPDITVLHRLIPRRQRCAVWYRPRAMLRALRLGHWRLQGVFRGNSNASSHSGCRVLDFNLVSARSPKRLPRCLASLRVCQNKARPGEPRVFRRERWLAASRERRSAP